MTRPILFRSHMSRRTRSGTADMRLTQRGYDWSHIRAYTDTDDIRDIAWNKMSPTGLSIRVRETQGDCDIISYIGTTPYDGFYIGSTQESRTSMIERSLRSIETSARFAGYQYSAYEGDSGLDTLLRIQPRNSLIFIGNTPITRDIELLSYHNDVIYLDFVHPFEQDPRSDLLFSGQVIDISAYLDEYRQLREITSNTLKKMRAAYIPIPTDTDLSDILNIFFKKRYTHG